MGASALFLLWGGSRTAISEETPRPNMLPPVSGAQGIVAGEAGLAALIVDRDGASSCKAGSLTSSPFIRFEFLPSAGLATTIPFAAGSTLEGMGPFSNDGVSQPVRGPVTHPPGFPLSRTGEVEKASGDDCSGRHQARRRIAPQCDEELARERHDHDAAHTPGRATRPLVEPLGELASWLMLKPAPRDLEACEIGIWRGRSWQCLGPG